jgi:cysteine-rich repeat protein
VVKYAMILFGLASASACLSADYSVADAGACPADDVCREGWVCVVGYCVPSADDVPVCGDGLHQDYAGEACDDGNQAADDGCTNDCNIAVCGDGLVRHDLSTVDVGYEECDDGNVNEGDGCSEACLSEVCGNGREDFSEECDDGNVNEGDGCSEACLSEVCGNGREDFSEECDDGNEVQTDACLNNCVAASCGDAHAQAGIEACDDGNELQTDACLNNCVAASCGDAHAQAGIEACDDGNAVQTDACLNNCVAARCGDTHAQAGIEACDDGNISNTDSCTDACLEARCGDGFARAGVDTLADAYEACDDGNDNEDICDEDCRWQPGASRGGAVRDCQTFRAAFPMTPDGAYWLNPDGGTTDNAFRGLCNMNTRGGGWTQVVNIYHDTATWNAWNFYGLMANSSDPEARFGVPMELFTDAELNGEDLEIMFFVNDFQTGPIYRGVNKDAWDSSLGMGNFDENGFDSATQEVWSGCDMYLGRDNDRWNWSIASRTTSENCANYSMDFSPRPGFLLEGSDANPEQAYAISGLNGGYRPAFGWLRIFVRRTP